MLAIKVLRKQFQLLDYAKCDGQLTQEDEDHIISMGREWHLVEELHIAPTHDWYKYNFDTKMSDRCWNYYQFESLCYLE